MELEHVFTFFQQQPFLVSLIYLPQHAFLWMLLPSEIIYYRRHPVNADRKMSKELLALTAKSLLNSLLVVLVILNVGRPATPFVTRIIESLSYFVALILLHLSEQYDVRDQTFLLSFWILELLMNGIRIVDKPALGSILFVATLLVLIALLVHSQLTKECGVGIRPNLIRSLYFSWFSEINRKVHISQLDDLGDLQESMKTVHLLRYSKDQEAFNGLYESVAMTEAQVPATISMWNLLRPFLRDLILSGFNRLVLTVLFFVCPFLLRQILRSDYQASSAENHFYVICIFIVSLVIAALNGQYMYKTQKIGLKIKSYLMTIIYEKSLKLKTMNNADVTLLTLDSTRFVDLLPNLHLLWSGPLIILISITGLLAVLGHSAWIGVFVMIVTIHLTKKITDKLRLLQKDLMDLKDPRIASTNEAVGMMQQIKFFCWEDFFQRRILQHRERELKILRSIIYWDAPKYLLGVVSPFLVSLSSFGVMILIGDASLLTLESAFVSIVLFNILKYPLSVLPILSSTWTATRASVDRIGEFLKAEEIQPLSPTPKPEGRSRTISETAGEFLGACRKALDTPVVSIRKANFQLEGKLILDKIDLQVQDGSFVVVTGPVGSGKSSLLAAILGELDLSGGTVNAAGQIAYVSQEPWILHTSIKENIIFGQEYQQQRYDQVIEGCALLPDLETFPDGDSTLIGERGITMSGGQKQRIALARAVYQHSELYLLDDPLSSVDGEVSDHIYRKVFSKEGLLTRKTVLLVTQNQAQFRDADQVVLMENGRISERHSYESYQEKYCAGHNTYREGLRNENSLRSKSLISDIQVENKALKDPTPNKVSPKVYAQYFKMFGWVSIAVVLLLNIAGPICDIFSTIWLSKWSITDHRTTIVRDNFFLGIYSLFILSLTAFLSLNSIVTTVRGIIVAKLLHIKLLHNVIHQPMTFFDKTSSGQIMNRFSSDLDVVDSKISLNVRDFLTNLCSVLCILILFCLNTSIYLIGIIVMIVIVYYYLLVYHLETSRQLKRLEARSKSPLILHYNESREGRATIRAFRQEQRFLDDFIKILDRHQRYYYLYLVSSRWLGVRLEIIGAIVIYFVAMLAVQNQATIGASNVGVSITYALRLIPLLNALVRVTALLEENATSLERIDRYLNESNELVLTDGKRQVLPNWPGQGKIEFVNFSMNHGDQRRCALKNVSVVFKSQEKIGIVGRTGAGKSSLISALFRLYPLQTEGAIVIDDINIEQIALRKLRRSITIIPQNPLLFSGTLRENLDPCGNQANDAELWKALECCNMKEIVAKLPQKLDTVIDERGSNLSVGQKQLLCLARGILQDSKIVVLDEATSTMDPETERTIQHVLKIVFQNRTVLTVAHRTNTIQQVDKVLCMKQGRVVNFEVPNNLVEQDLLEL